MKFDEKGEIQDLRSNNHWPSLGDGDVQRVEQHFIKHPRASICHASSNLNISQSSVHKTLKQKIKFKPYRPTHVQALPDITRERRMAACQRFLVWEIFWQSHQQQDGFPLAPIKSRPKPPGLLVLGGGREKGAGEEAEDCGGTEDGGRNLYKRSFFWYTIESFW